MRYLFVYFWYFLCGMHILFDLIIFGISYVFMLMWDLTRITWSDQHYHKATYWDAAYGSTIMETYKHYINSL
jgi:hypothetical protein